MDFLEPWTRFDKYIYNVVVRVSLFFIRKNPTTVAALCREFPSQPFDCVESGVAVSLFIFVACLSVRKQTC